MTKFTYVWLIISMFLFFSFLQFRIPPNAKEGKTSRNDPEYLIVIDFEATCEEKNYPDYPHEIIEFPAIIIRVDDVQVSKRLSAIGYDRLQRGISSKSDYLCVFIVPRYVILSTRLCDLSSSLNCQDFAKT